MLEYLQEETIITLLELWRWGIACGLIGFCLGTALCALVIAVLWRKQKQCENKPIKMEVDFESQEIMIGSRSKIGSDRFIINNEKQG